MTDRHPSSQPPSHVALAYTAFTTSHGLHGAQLMLTNPRDAFRGQSRSPKSSIPYDRYSFLLCNSNLVFNTRRFYDIRLQKMSWPWNRGQSSLKVIERGTILHTGYGFLLVFYRNFVSNTHRYFEIFAFSNIVTLKSGLKVTQGHHSIEHTWLPIDVLW